MHCIPNSVNYDDRFDILYFSIADTSNSYGDQIDSHMILLKDLNTDEITGVTIYGYKRFFTSDLNAKQKLSKYISLPKEYLS